MKKIILLTIGLIILATSVSAQPLNTPVCTKNRDQSECHIAISPLNSNYIMAVFGDSRNDGTRKSGYALSFDGGITWQDSFFLPTGAWKSSDPSCAFDRYGNTFYGYIATVTGEVKTYVSRTKSFYGSKYLHKWSHTLVQPVGNQQDKPWIAVDNSGGTYDGRVFVTWHGGGIRFAYSTDQGSTYQVNPNPLNTSSLNVKFPMVAVGPNGSVYVLYRYFETGNKRIVIRRSIDGGVTFEPEKTICNLLGGIAIADDPPYFTVDGINGFIYIVFRDCESESIPTLRIKYTMGDPSADYFFPPIEIDAPYYYVSIPAITVSPYNGLVAVSFVASPCTSQNVYITKSFDGFTFTTPELVTNISSNCTLKGSGFIDYMGIACTNDYIIPIWTDFRNSTQQNINTDIYSAKLQWGFPKTSTNVVKPTKFALSQNYPNPFNPTTNFDYALPVDVHVTLKVYNALGQEVAVLVNEYQSVGYKTVEFNASQLPSGLYFYRLTAGSFTDIKKMILVK